VQTRLSRDPRVKCRTNSSLGEMLHKTGVAKSRNYRTNSHHVDAKNKSDIRYLMRGGGGSQMPTRLSIQIP
jgi:hypothetical protein